MAAPAAMDDAFFTRPEPREQRVVLVGVGGVVWSGDAAVRYSTLLGSCIAVCLFDAVARKGGINHFLLAEGPSRTSDDTRYGEVALPLLSDNLVRAGCDRARLRAYVAGGADLLAQMRPIGTENAAFALRWLEGAGIEILRNETGGRNARRINFVPTTAQMSVAEVNNTVPVS